MKPRKTEVARGWGLRIGGSKPFLSSFHFCLEKEQAEFEKITAEKDIPILYYRPVRVVLVPLAEYRRLKRLEKKEKI